MSFWLRYHFLVVPVKVRNYKTHVSPPSCSCWEMKISEAVSQERHYQITCKHLKGVSTFSILFLMLAEDHPYAELLFCTFPVAKERYRELHEPALYGSAARWLNLIT